MAAVVVVVEAMVVVGAVVVGAAVVVVGAAVVVELDEDLDEDPHALSPSTLMSAIATAIPPDRTPWNDFLT
jgi:hypothetical protein